MSKPNGVRLNCFSPPIMLATLLIEFSLALYTIWRYKLTAVTRLITLIFVGLATFQLAEYFVCTGTAQAEIWSRIGFVAITALPPLGLHLMHQLAGKSQRGTVTTAYVSMAGFIGFFLLHPAAFAGQACTGNYVIFQIGYQLGGLYALYYYGWLLTALLLGRRWANELIVEKSKSARKKLQTIRAFIIGYLVFLVPTAVTNTINPDTTDGIPSIMCGFAIIFALIVGLYILPRVGESRNPKA